MGVGDWVGGKLGVGLGVEVEVAVGRSVEVWVGGKLGVGPGVEVEVAVGVKVGARVELIVGVTVIGATTVAIEVAPDEAQAGRKRRMKPEKKSQILANNLT